MEAASNPSSGHIVAITPPLHGHAIRLIRLSMKLASMGFTITFITAHSQFKSIAHEAVPFISMNKIHFETFEDLDHKEHHIKKVIEGMASKIPKIDKLVQCAEIKQNCDVCCIFADVLLLPFLGPIRDTRPNCQIVGAAIGCASFWLIDRHLGKRMGDGGINFSALPDTIPDFPTKLSFEDFPIIFLAKNLTAEFHESLSKHMEQANWIVVNTFDEIEGFALNALRQTYKLPFLSVGPLHICKGIEKEPEEEEEEGNTNSSKILSWLSTKQPSSVIYISFGTVLNLSLSNMYELAMGLEASNQNFLWVIRSDSLLQSLPDGFVERSSERGLIVDWCPQIRVLKHSSVGAFLTHGGWNSVLEALTYGVPMLGWPQNAEQNLNCKLLVDVWKLGSRINSVSAKLDGTTRAVGREEIEAALRGMNMEDARGNEMKKRAVELKAAARRAVAENGSSTLNMLQLVNAIKKIPTQIQ